MKIFFIALLTITLSFTASAQELTPKDIFLKAQQELLKHDRVLYTATMRKKFFSNDDTLVFKGNVALIRIPQDTIFGGKIEFSTDDSTMKKYDGNDIYTVNRKSKQVTQYNAHNGQEWAISGNITGNIIWDDFLKPENFEKIRNRTSYFLKDTIIEKRQCYQIQVTRPDEGDFSDWKSWFCITKDSFVPVLFKNQVRFQDNYQYDELALHSWDFSRPYDILFLKEKFPIYTITKYVEPDRDEPRTLTVGTAAPKIWGNDYFKNISNDTIDFSGKVTVLDFWYMSCYPCIKAIPQMEELFKKYSARGLQAVGVNAFDNNEKALKKLPQFLKNNPIEYKILMVENSFAPHFQVSMWPTFYVIDQSGKIAYAQAGFSEESFKEMENVIQKLLE